MPIWDQFWQSQRAILILVQFVQVVSSSALAKCDARRKTLHSVYPQTFSSSNLRHCLSLPSTLFNFDLFHFQHFLSHIYIYRGCNFRLFSFSFGFRDLGILTLSPTSTSGYTRFFLPFIVNFIFTLNWLLGFRASSPSAILTCYL